MKNDRSDRAEVLKFIPKTYSKVLEIGCNKGNFIKNLDTKCEKWGIEPNPEAAEKAKNIVEHLFTGGYEKYYTQLPDNYFDLIICNDVIEHLYDHDMFFDSIKSKMTTNSSLIGSIPNVRYYRNLYHLLWEKDWKYEDKGILDRTHLHFFTKKSFKRTLNEHHFKIHRLEGINKSQIRSLRLKAFFYMVSLFSFTSISDITYQQFGFRISKQ